MFNKGKYADQVDALSQALKFIGEPNSVDVFIASLKAEVLKQYNINIADLTVCFDHPEKNKTFMVNGRYVFREGDGYYWVTENEWNFVACVLPGVYRLG